MPEQHGEQDGSGSEKGGDFDETNPRKRNRMSFTGVRRSAAVFIRAHA